MSQGKRAYLMWRLKHPLSLELLDEMVLGQYKILRRLENSVCYNLLEYELEKLLFEHLQNLYLMKVEKVIEQRNTQSRGLRK